MTGTDTTEKQQSAKLRGRDRRSLNLSTKLTAHEARTIEKAASDAGKTPSEWARETVLDAAHSSSTRIRTDTLLTEIVALQLFLTNVLSPIACGERMTAAQYQELMRNVKTNKHRAAREVIAQYVRQNGEELLA